MKPCNPESRLIRRQVRWLLPLALLVLAGLACSVPSLSRFSPSQPGPEAGGTPQAVTGAAETPAGSQMETPGASSTAQGLLPVQPDPEQIAAPALVEVSPLPGSELGAGAAPVLYFNQPMDRASVEAAFQVQPEIPGRLEWVDAATLRFVPEQALEPETRLSLTIDSSARAANGQAMEEPAQVDFRFAGPLRLVERLPAPGALEINPTSAVVATFNRPVVPLGADPQSAAPAFTLDPPAEGRGEWINTSTYIFYPQPALAGGIQYSVHLNRDLTSTAGSPFEADGESTGDWSFTTAAPQLLSVRPSPDERLLLDDEITLVFNQPMNAASVETNFSLIGPDGSPVIGTAGWNETATEMTFKPIDLLERAADYTLVLFAAAESQGGASLGSDFAAVLSTVPAFSVVETSPAAGQTVTSYGGYGSVALTFSAPVAPRQDLDSLITLRPEIPGLRVERSYSGMEIYLSGYFQPSASYSLTISPDLRDRWDAALGRAFTFTFKTSRAEPSLAIPARQAGAAALFVPYLETNLQANTVNITRLSLSRGRLTLEEFIRAHENYQGLVDWPSKVQSNWVRLYYSRPDETQTIDIPMTRDGSPLDPGLYFLQIEPTPALSEVPEQPMLLVVSPIQMALKISDRQAFVWAVRIAGNEPAADLNIMFYDERGEARGSCVTGAEGTCQAELARSGEPFMWLFAAAGRPGDPDFSLASTQWSSGVNGWEFDLPYAFQSSEDELYLYTDRPIYRPGQTVNFRAVLRGQENGRYFFPEQTELAVELVSPYDPISSQRQTLSSLTLPLTPFGTASGAFTLPEDARPGTYWLRVDDSRYPEVSFEVAAYRKPEIDLQVSFDQTDLLAGEDVQARVEANYYFGAPAGSLPVRWALYRRTAFIDLPGGLTAGAMPDDWMSAVPDAPAGDFVMEGEGQTLPDGSLAITLPAEELQARFELQRGQNAGSIPQELTLEVTIEDLSGLPVSARSTARLHPAPTYIGVRAEAWSVQAGEEIGFSIRSVDWYGGPVPDVPLKAVFRRVDWTRVQDDPFSRPEYEPVYANVGSTDFRTSEHGEARLAFIPPDPGTYQIEVTGEDGALTQAQVWVGGPGAAAWPDLANQHILLQKDAEQYRPGDTARIFIPNPFPDGARALITVERGKVMRSMVIEIDGPAYQLDLPLTVDDAPNIYVSALLLGRTGGRPDFRVGYTSLQVDPAAQLLHVAVQTTPAQPEPGQPVTIDLLVTGPNGEPVQAELSVALIDKAVLALADPNAPEIVKAFYGEQPLSVSNSLSLANYHGRHMQIPGGMGGGGGSLDAPLEAVRSNFADTAFWSGTVETDEAGRAQVSLTLPDNLTTWRVDVRGLTADTEVGQAKMDITASKPLLIRPVAPRFAVAGDHMALSAVVHNNTQDPLQVSVRLEGSGFTLDDLNQAVQPVDLPPGEQRAVYWWGTVQDIGALDLTFSASAGSLSDAAQPELGPIPVLAYSALQTFSTAGMIAEPGERVELVSLPRTFIPTGGELRLELAPSLSAVVIDGLRVLEDFPRDFTEPVLSRLLPNLAALQAVNTLVPEDGAALTGSQRDALQQSITESTARLARLQNPDGGWGWAAGYESDPFISSYAVFGLSRAAQAGVFVDQEILQRGVQYLSAQWYEPTMNTEEWQLDRLAFLAYALRQAGVGGQDLDALYELRGKLSPWGKAFTALAMQGQDERAATLIADLQSSASRTASGASWSDSNPAWRSWSTTNFTTAAAAYAIAQADPSSPLLVDAARYLVSSRRGDGAWDNSYETSWALMALAEIMRAAGDLQPGYAYAAVLNGTPLIEGQVSGLTEALNPVQSSVPLAQLSQGGPNALQIWHGEGSGRLYYRAYLQVNRPAETAAPVERGLSITRQYYPAGAGCRSERCQPVDSVDLLDPQPLQVRLSLVVPEDMYYVVVEDYIPAGAEVLNVNLKTAQQGVIPGVEEEPEAAIFDPADPFNQGWGWWLFADPQVYDDRVRWVVDYLPAGTYELTYRLDPFIAGEFRVLPARAWQYYFPEVEGRSAGSMITIR